MVMNFNKEKYPKNITQLTYKAHLIALCKKTLKGELISPY